ncbi:hypothetical protein REPUB_Repub19eG0119100 [Reevesia pubescens]
MNESVALPSNCFVPKVARKSACFSSVPLRRSERLLLMQATKKNLESLKCNNSLVPDMEMNITSLQCPVTHSGTNLKFSTGASLSFDGKNIMASSGDNQQVKKKPGRTRKSRPEEGGKTNKGATSLNINSSIIGTGQPSMFSKENSEVVKGLISCPVWRDETAFNNLLTHLHDNGLAMKTIVDDNVLLVFTSPQLPYEYWRVGGKYYLWAVFSGKNAFFPLSQEPHLCTSNSELLMDSNLSGNAATADERDSCRNLDKQGEQKGKKRMKWKNSDTRLKSEEMPLPIVSRSPTRAVAKNTIEEQCDEADSRTLVEKCARSTNENVAGDQALVDVPLIPSLCTRSSTYCEETVPNSCLQGGDFSLEGQVEGMRASTTEGVGSQSIGASVFHMVHTFDDVNSEGIMSADSCGKPERRYSVKPHLVSTLDAIIEKHGDIAQDCLLTSGEMLTYALERVCEAVQVLEALPFNKLQSSVLKSLYSTISDAELLKLNVKWLRDRCDELMDTVSGIQQYKNLKVDIKKYTTMIQSKQKAVDLKRTKMMKLHSDIQLLESEVALMTAKYERANKTISSVKSKYRYFSHNSLVNGLI